MIAFSKIREMTTLDLVLRLGATFPVSDISQLPNLHCSNISLLSSFIVNQIYLKIAELDFSGD